MTMRLLFFHLVMHPSDGILSKRVWKRSSKGMPIRLKQEITILRKFCSNNALVCYDAAQMKQPLHLSNMWNLNWTHSKIDQLLFLFSAQALTGGNCVNVPMLIFIGHYALINFNKQSLVYSHRMVDFFMNHLIWPGLHNCIMNNYIHQNL